MATNEYMIIKKPDGTEVKVKMSPEQAAVLKPAGNSATNFPVGRDATVVPFEQAPKGGYKGAFDPVIPWSERGKVNETTENTAENQKALDYAKTVAKMQEGVGIEKGGVLPYMLPPPNFADKPNQRPITGDSQSARIPMVTDNTGRTVPMNSPDRGVFIDGKKVETNPNTGRMILPEYTHMDKEWIRSSARPVAPVQESYVIGGSQPIAGTEGKTFQDRQWGPSGLQMPINVTSIDTGRMLPQKGDADYDYWASVSGRPSIVTKDTTPLKGLDRPERKDLEYGSVEGGLKKWKSGPPIKGGSADMKQRREEHFAQQKELKQMDIEGRSADKRADIQFEERRADVVNTREYDKMRGDAMRDAWKEKGLNARHDETMERDMLNREDRINGHIVDAQARKDAAEFTFAGMVILHEGRQEFEKARDDKNLQQQAIEKQRAAIVELMKNFEGKELQDHIAALDQYGEELWQATPK